MEYSSLNVAADEPWPFFPASNVRLAAGNVIVAVSGTYQRIVGDTFAAVGPVQPAVLFQEPEKQGRCYPFVTIHERMVLHQEVQQMGRLLLQTRVQVLACESLHHRAQRALKAGAF